MLESNSPSEHPDVRYEKSDASITGVAMFGVILLGMGLMVFVTAYWVFAELKVRDDRKYPPLPDLAAKERAHLPADLARIPKPLLQENEPVDLADLKKKEDESLEHYGWVDRKSGIVRIPIDKAMLLLSDPKTATAHGIRVRPVKEGEK